jgi:hypothetical protein
MITKHLFAQQVCLNAVNLVILQGAQALWERLFFFFREARVRSYSSCKIEKILVRLKRCSLLGYRTCSHQVP